MEQEIDLSPYFRALQRFWWVVLLSAALFGALAVIATQVLDTDTYQATALVAVIEPRQLVEFDIRFEDTSPRSQLVRALPEMARSDEMMASLMAEIPAGQVEDILELSRMLKAESGEDPNLVRLIVTDSDPILAAEIANRWAALFINRANRLYGTQSADMLSFYDAQKAASAQLVEVAEQALVDYQARNRFLWLDTQLRSLQELQTGYLTGKNNIAIAQDNIEALLAMLRQSTDPTVSYTDQLTLLSMQMKAFNLEGYIPFLLTNEAGGPLTTQDRQAQIANLEQLLQSLTGLATETDAALLALEPQILQVQRLREEMDREGRRLLRERDVAVETYTALARRADEERVSSQDTTVGVGLMSAAGTPTHPAPSNLLRNLGMGLFFGGLVGAAVAIILARRRTVSGA